MADYVTVADAATLEDGECTEARVDGDRVAVFRIDEEFHAVQNACPHQDAPLCDGMVVGSKVACPMHGSTFEVPTGEVLGPPADEGLEVYPVVLEDGEVRVAVEE